MGFLQCFGGIDEARRGAVASQVVAEERQAHREESADGFGGNSVRR